MSTELTYDQYVKAGYTQDFLNWFINAGCQLPHFVGEEEEKE